MLSGRKFLAIVAYLSEKGIKHMMLKANLSSEGDHSVEMILVYAGEKVGGLQWSLGCFLWSLVPVGAPQMGGPGEVLSWLVKPRLSFVLRHPLKSWQNPVRGLQCCKWPCRASEHLPRYQGMSKQMKKTQKMCNSPTNLHKSIATEMKGSFTPKVKKAKFIPQPFLEGVYVITHSSIKLNLSFPPRVCLAIPLLCHGDAADLLGHQTWCACPTPI